MFVTRMPMYSSSVAMRHEHDVATISILAAGVPVYTQCQFQNHAGDDLYVTLDSHHPWHGHGNPPTAIQDQEAGNFKHSADPEGSIAGVAYVLGEKNLLKWIIAWSNAEEQPNKVYTDILAGDAHIDWDEIKNKLKHSGTSSNVHNKFGYSSEDVNTSTPKVKATLRPVA